MQNNLSPMMKQYMQIKEQHKGHILFFRLGDFYEMFFDDAITVSKELELTLTGRDCGLSEKAPMCGVPHHSSESYIKRLVNKGYKIAICEQIGVTSAQKGIVKREVVRVVTPGTISDGTMLDESKNNYISSIYVEDNGFGISFADISTGQVYITDFNEKNIDQMVINELVKFSPSEILFNENFTNLKNTMEFLKSKLNCTAEYISPEKCDYELCKNNIQTHFERDLSSFGDVDKNRLMFISLGILMDYLNSTQKDASKRIVHVTHYENEQFVYLDINARKNLELTENLRTKSKKASLLWVLDKTKTAMGKRLLRKFIEQPLINLAEINLRQQAVLELYNNHIKRDEVLRNIDRVYDLERLMTKIVYRSINPRELKSFSYTAAKIPKIKEAIFPFKSGLITQIYNDIDDLEDIVTLINSAIEDESPINFKEGGVIKKGFNQELDSYRSLFQDTKTYINNIEKQERERTGIKNLKIGYNKVFGYYIEITKSYLQNVPDNYIRKQTLSNCERFIVQELTDLESKITYASERITTLEQEIFNKIIEFVCEKITSIQKTAGAIALLDVLTALAEVALKNNYVCPEITIDGKIEIEEGFHPVVQEMLDEEVFVPNDTYMNLKSDKIMLITGPNMAGKSTYMRQIAIIVIMAQIGSFVPAKKAKIGIVDKIFTRVGASDDLSGGQSTFMVEMSEVAEILKYSTMNSLIILDEIGRGTSTFDGMSIARSVIEYILKAKNLGAKTLFATHYHELTELEKEFPAVKNYNIAVKKDGENITFLRKIIRGSADDSYGIEVAKLAGIPEYVINRAKEILVDLESKIDTNVETITKFVCNEPDTLFKEFEKNKGFELEQQKMRDEMKNNAKIINNLKTVDIDNTSPMEALKLLSDMKKLL